MRPRARKTLAVILLGLAAWIGWRAAHPTVAATALILDLTGQQKSLRAWLPIRRATVTTRDIDIPARHGAIHARLYIPDTRAPRALAVFPGVHGGGVDEPRMHALSQHLAGAGWLVLTAPLPELRAYTIRPRSTDDIEDVSAWLASQRDLVPRGRIGIVGISFAGGLALVAAARPSIASRVDLVAALGTHGDLPRAMRFLCIGEMPDGRVRTPHDYGAAVILLAGASHFVPPAQVEGLRRAITTFLDGSSYYNDPVRSKALFDDARAQERALPEPARTVMSWVNNRDVATLGPKLLPYLEELGGAAALSPERSAAVQVPVFLLHGAEDNVIPFTETPLIERYLRAKGNTKVRTLLTPLISHANVSADAKFADVWALIRFWAAMLQAVPGS
jgi:dienelactone hydrolase